MEASSGGRQLHAEEHAQRGRPRALRVQDRRARTCLPAHQRPLGRPRSHRDHEPELGPADHVSPTAYDLTLAAWRWLEFVGLIGFVGVVVLRRLAGMRPALQWARRTM